VTQPLPVRIPSYLESVLGANRPSTDWYGLDLQWQYDLEASARREYRQRLRPAMYLSRIEYRLPVEVRGRLDDVPVTIAFHRWPRYECWGLAPCRIPAGARRSRPGVTPPDARRRRAVPVLPVLSTGAALTAAERAAQPRRPDP
jgi:hypothetical protein